MLLLGFSVFFFFGEFLQLGQFEKTMNIFHF
jgi:hypothetical protein